MYGHVIQESTLSPAAYLAAGDRVDGGRSWSGPRLAEYPHLVELADTRPGSDYSVDQEFPYGLDLILHALERAATPVLAEPGAWRA